MDIAPEFPTLSITRHPLIQHKLTILRDRRTPTKIFKELVDEIAMLMAYEATNGLQLEAVPVETPLEPATGWQVSGKKLTLVPILRAGLGMVEGILRLVPAARVGHVGLYRDHDTLEPVERVDGRVLVVVAARVGPARLIDNDLIEQVATLT